METSPGVAEAAHHHGTEGDEGCCAEVSGAFVEDQGVDDRYRQGTMLIRQTHTRQEIDTLRPDKLQVALLLVGLRQPTVL